MNYQLLTGATGLLGNYLLRDLLQAGQRVAVLVRPSRRLSARQRVETAMADWESQLGVTLPRPVVLEGDITQPDLGMDAVSMRWVGENCDTVIHNAASLTFQSTSDAGEPWQSNVNGTKHVLELCRNLQIRRLHHVSTAYIAGQRAGRVLETEADVGQELSNDYEQSKLTAEKLVREADFLDSLTVFRPGIIIGDSETGFTTTYHGFYAALQLTHTIVKSFPKDETGLVGGERVRLALNGNETKHLVPVDWCSAFMAHVITRPELHGQTYHLTPQHPVTTRLIRDVLEEACEYYGSRLIGAGTKLDDLTEAETIFYEHIRVYNSYWKNDPIFDRTNTEAAAPHLPCPHVDKSLLLKLSRIAIDSGFPTPSKKPTEPEFDAARYFQTLLNAETTGEPSARNERAVGLDVVGPGGGQFQLLTQRGQLTGAENGIHGESAAVCRLDSTTFRQLVTGKTSVANAMKQGKIEWQGGQPGAKSQAVSVLEQACTHSVPSPS